MKTIFILCLVILALLAGQPMYLGIKLFSYGDYIQGSLTLASGIIMALYFVWALGIFDKTYSADRTQRVQDILRKTRFIEKGNIARSKPVKNANEVWKAKKREMMLGIAMTALIAVSRIVYECRFSHYGNILIWIGITVVFVLLVEVYLLIVFAKKGMEEVAFRNKIREKEMDWKYMGYATWDEVSAFIMEETVMQCYSWYYAKSMVSILSYCLFVQCMLEFSGNKAIFAIGTVVIWWFSKNIRKKSVLESRDIVSSILNSGYDRSVVGFFVEYYKLNDYKYASLQRSVQTDLIVALDTQGAWNDVLEINEVIFYDESFVEKYAHCMYNWSAYEGLRNYQKCVETFNKMDFWLKEYAVTNKEVLKNHEIYKSMTTKNYENAIQLLESVKETSYRKSVWKNRLIADARERIFL